MKSIAATTMLFAFGFATSVRADSDGYFCFAADYFAYQFGGAPPIASHDLYIVPLGEAHGIGEPIKVSLPRFQVHGIRCHDRQIEIASYWNVHRLILDSALELAGQDTIPLSEAGALPNWAAQSQENLGFLGAPSMETRFVELSTDSRGVSYLLEIDVLMPEGRRCIDRIASYIIEVAPDANGTVTDNLKVYDGPGRPSC